MFKYILLFALLPLGHIQAQFIEDFSDGNFTEDPTWYGDVDKFQVNNGELQLFDQNPSSNNRTKLYTLAPTSLAASTSWSFYVFLDFSPTPLNHAIIYLSSYITNYENDACGYYLKIGGISGLEDALELYRQDGDTHTLLISGDPGSVNHPVTLRVRVTRSTVGVWTLEADYTGGSNYTPQGSAFDNTYPNGNYFGWDCRYTSTRFDAFFLDDIEIDPITPPIVSPKMIAIPGGNFEMGCTETQTNCSSDELPVHSIELSDFYMSKYEITQQEWANVIPGFLPDYDYGTNPTFPVYGINLYDAFTFCNRLSLLKGHTPCYYFDESFTEVFDTLSEDWSNVINIYWKINADGYRLPTEAEWEYAARGGQLSQNFQYSGSSQINNVAWFEENNCKEVGTKSPNELGLHDLSGNIWELCWDFYQGDYYDFSLECNPLGPENGTLRVKRGGSWSGTNLDARISNRSTTIPSNRDHLQGLRLVRGLIPFDDCTIACDRQADSLELVEFYQATNGASWNTPWVLEEPIDNWHGVTTNIYGCVSKLTLSNRGVTGPIINFHLPYLKEFHCDNNQLSGSIPDFSGIPQLESFLCFNNNLNGTIPDFSNISFLTVLDCSDNDLTGIIPAFSNLPILAVLKVSNNRLSGEIPPLNAFCPNLMWFEHMNNRNTFSDIIPYVPSNKSLTLGNGGDYIYSPQDSIFADTLIEGIIGEPLIIDLGIDENIPDNEYRWYKDSESYSANLGENKLSFSSLANDDLGTYWVEISNFSANELRLTSYPIHITYCIDGIPNILSGTDSTYVACEGEPLPVIMLEVDDEVTIDWYSSEAGNDLIVEGTSVFTPGSSGTYYAEARSLTSNCINPNRMPVDVVIDPEPPILIDDRYNLSQNNPEISFSVTENDILSPGWSIELTQQPQQGIATLSNEGILQYELTNPDFLGVDAFTYQICTAVCIDTCMEATIRISTLDDCVKAIEANLPTGFTPDGDGVNDTFDPLDNVVTSCLPDPQNAELIVVNTWGELLFHAKPYQAWDGRFNGRIVPQGVYYYSLRFEVEGTVTLKKPVHVLK